MGKTQAIDDLSGIHGSPTTLLVQGRNTFGDEIYTFVRLPIDRIDEVKKVLASGANFIPAHFGAVIAAGRGKPNIEVIEEVGIPEFMLYFKPKQALPGHLTGQQSTQGGY